MNIIEFIKKTPKSELHLHIEGTLESDHMFALAKRNNIQIPFANVDEVINILFYVAEADGNVSNSELIMIRNIANIFNLNDSQFDGIKESRKSSDKLNPYVVLGCDSSDDFATIRKKYLTLSKEHHPDVLVSKGVPKEIIEESKKKMRAINSAFDAIEKMKSR